MSTEMILDFNKYVNPNDYDESVRNLLSRYVGLVSLHSNSREDLVIRTQTSDSLSFFANHNKQNIVVTIDGNDFNVKLDKPLSYACKIDGFIKNRVEAVIDSDYLQTGDEILRRYDYVVGRDEFFIDNCQPTFPKGYTQDEINDIYDKLSVHDTSMVWKKFRDAMREQVPLVGLELVVRLVPKNTNDVINDQLITAHMVNLAVRKYVSQYENTKDVRTMFMSTSGTKYGIECLVPNFDNVNVVLEQADASNLSLIVQAIDDMVCEQDGVEIHAKIKVQANYVVNANKLTPKLTRLDALKVKQSPTVTVTDVDIRYQNQKYDWNLNQVVAERLYAFNYLQAKGKIELR